jgi:hypothetical protein
MLNKSFAHLLEMRLEKALIVSLPTTETPLLQMKNFQKKKPPPGENVQTNRNNVLLRETKTNSSFREK